MKTRKRKLISILLAVILTFSVFSVVPCTAGALESGDFKYKLLDDGTAEITRYTGSAEVLEIPSEIDGYKVTSISRNAFAGCETLKNVTIGNGITSIGFTAFALCTSLESVFIPASMTDISRSVFSDCTSFVSIEVDGDNEYYSSADGVLFNKDKTELIMYPIAKSGDPYTIPDTVTDIAGYAFEGCTGLKSIVIPDSVTSIEPYAFLSCKGLVEVTIPESITRIERNTFCDCENLAKITIPDSITSIGSGAFDSTAWFYSQPSGVIYAGKFAYSYSDKIEMPENTKITIKDGTVGIADSAFEACENISQVIIPDSVTSIGVYAFDSCTALESVVIPDSVTSIGDCAFGSCRSLAGVTLSQNLENIGAVAFVGCESLSDITIPDSVTSIGYGALSYCTSLKNINVDGNNKCYSSADGVLFNKDKTELIVFPSGKSDTSYAIPDSVTSISKSAFSDCENLESITIPDSVTSIGNLAFSSTAWYDNQPDGVVYAGKVAYAYKGEMPQNTSIVLNADTVGIAEYAFFNCYNLTDITIPDSVISVDEYAFYNCLALSRVIIPESVTSIGNFAFGYHISQEPFVVGEIKDESFTIYGYAGTDSERYAEEKGFAFFDLYATATPDEPLPSSPDEPFPPFPDVPLPSSPDEPLPATPDEPEYIIGNVNGDTVLDVNDVTYLQMYLAGYPSAPIDESDSVQFEIADFNKDGIIDVNDATAIQMKLAGYAV